MVCLCCFKPLSLRSFVSAAEEDELRGFLSLWSVWDMQGRLVSGSGARGSGIQGQHALE